MLRTLALVARRPALAKAVLLALLHALADTPTVWRAHRDLNDLLQRVPAETWVSVPTSLQVTFCDPTNHAARKWREWVESQIGVELELAHARAILIGAAEPIPVMRWRHVPAQDAA